MGKRKYNAKGRQVVETLIDDSQTKKIKLDLNNKNEDNEYSGFDKSNPLVLPSKKRKTKIMKEKLTNVTRILSKKQRKALEKIVDKKKKKEERAALLDKLASVKLPDHELKQYTSITHVQTKGLKKHLKENTKKTVKNYVDEEAGTSNNQDNNGQGRFSSIAGRKKRLALLKKYSQDDDEESNDEKQTNKNYNVIGFDMSSSDDDGDDIKESDINDTLPNPSEIKQENSNSVPAKTKSSTENNSSAQSSSTATTNNNSSAIPANHTKAIESSSSNTSISSTINITKKSSVYIHLDRNSSIQAARLKLPILGEEQVIMETINENQIIIIAGETGSGKTTQIPQFLYEAGYAEKKLIGITEPRRVAAISMSKRVAHEMNLSTDIISYLIRFEGNTTAKTKIKFMTDGVLFKEIENDFLLSKYSVVILDEAHERSVYTDILIGLLSRIVPLRYKRGNPLKLIIMSATLRIEDFTQNRKLFNKSPPVIKIESRQFPVTIHFNKRTSDDYVKDAFNKAVKIHNKLPEGGILIFLTGQQEVNYLVKKLRKAFPYRPQRNENEEQKRKSDNDNDDAAASEEDDFDLKRILKKSKNTKKRTMYGAVPLINLDDYKIPTDDTEADIFDRDNMIDEDDIDELNSDDQDEADDDINNIGNNLRTSQPLWVLPLYSLLSSNKQSKVFDKPPDGTRLCVVSTNVAETSLTIPNIKYVIDCGRQKTRIYDKITGVSAFIVTFTNKASANQRAGRAGRTSPGHCYRLYSSAVFNDEFELFAVPDIQKKPVEHLMLQMKCMGIDKVVNFPFPSPPDRVQLLVAEEKLKILGALCGKQEVTKVTTLGKIISTFPIAPKFGKMLALTYTLPELLQYTICMVAALSVQEVLIDTMAPDDSDNLINNKSKWLKRHKSWAGTGQSLLLGDPNVLLCAVGASEYSAVSGKLQEFCRLNGLREKAIHEIRKLRVQLTNHLNLHIANLNICVDPKMRPPNDTEAKFLREILLTGLIDQVARKIPADELKDIDDRTHYKYAYRCPNMEDPIFMHSSSVLRKQTPEWVIYQEIYEIKNGTSTKMFMRGITAIEPEWLLTFGELACNIKSIKDKPEPRYDNDTGNMYCHVDATFGRSAWELPLTEIPMKYCDLSVKYFSYHLFNGDVFPKFNEFKEVYRSVPKSFVKIYSKNIPHILAILNKLSSKEIDSKSKIIEEWNLNQSFLFDEFCDYLLDSNRTELAGKWPLI